MPHDVTSPVLRALDFQKSHGKDESFAATSLKNGRPRRVPKT